MRKRYFCWGMLFLIAANLLLYFTNLFNYFYWDDFIWLDLARKSLVDYYQGKAMLFRPLLYGYFKIGFALFSTQAAFYHGINLALHIANVLLIYFLTRALSRNETQALLAGLFFTLMSSPAEAVLWITAIGSLFMTFFLLLALLCFIYAVMNDRNFFAWLGSLFFVMAQLFHQAGISFLLVLAVLIWIYSESRKKFWLTVPVAGVSLGAILFYRVHYYVGVSDHPGEYICGFGRSLIALVLAPDILRRGNLILTKWHSPVLFSWPLIGAIFIGVSAAAVYMIIRLRKESVFLEKSFLFGSGWILATLLPYVYYTVGGFATGPYTYLPSIGWAIVLATVTASLLQGLSRRFSQGVLVGCIALWAMGNLILLQINKNGMAAEMAKTKEFVTFVHEEFKKELDSKIYIYDVPDGYLSELKATVSLFSGRNPAEITFCQGKWDAAKLPDDEHFRIYQCDDATKFMRLVCER